MLAIDPNLFHLDWDRTFEVLAGIAIVAALLERALSVVFENRLFVDSRFDGKGTKEMIAFGVALVICIRWELDAISIVLLSEQTTVLGEVVTAGVVAGGTKAFVKLFRDLMDIKSAAYRESRDARAAPAEEPPKPPPSRKSKKAAEA